MQHFARAPLIRGIRPGAPAPAPRATGKIRVDARRTIVEFFDTARDAFLAGQKIYADGMFSVQEVTDVPADLGFFSHALPHRTCDRVAKVQDGRIDIAYGCKQRAVR
ncbi:MAG TPA: hypothetical protein VF395_11370 [Polyangiaceae bacterium]